MGDDVHLGEKDETVQSTESAVIQKPCENDVAQILDTEELMDLLTDIWRLDVDNLTEPGNFREECTIRSFKIGEVWVICG